MEKKKPQQFKIQMSTALLCSLIIKLEYTEVGLIGRQKGEWEGLLVLST